jgi:hypothetical protein
MGVKIRLPASGSKPIPVSRTSATKWPENIVCGDPDLPSAGVNFEAFFSRFQNACWQPVNIPLDLRSQRFRDVSAALWLDIRARDVDRALTASCASIGTRRAPACRA